MSMIAKINNLSPEVKLVVAIIRSATEDMHCSDEQRRADARRFLSGETGMLEAWLDLIGADIPPDVFLRLAGKDRK